MYQSNKHQDIVKVCSQDSATAGVSTVDAGMMPKGIQFQMSRQTDVMLLPTNMDD
jgi:hypothetical protein